MIVDVECRVHSLQASELPPEFAVAPAPVMLLDAAKFSASYVIHTYDECYDVVRVGETNCFVANVVEEK